MTYVNVSGDGTIILSNKVTCDGFQYDIPVRIQTHIHQDHLDEFDRSKGFQDIFMSEATRDLLVAERDADLPIRSNISALPLKTINGYEDIKIQILDSGHMLGSIQVCVTLPSGVKCGYSGDFNWPIDDVIAVDELVLDSTYGSPSSVRRYSQDDAESSLLEIVSNGLKHGPVYIKAHKGTLERAINCLNGVFKYPVIVSSKQYKIVQVYQRYGYNLTEVFPSGTPIYDNAMQEGCYIMLCGYYERSPDNATSVILSAYHSGMFEPYVQYSNRAFSVALTSHADYVGTMEYVKATGAQFVITDNYRGGKGVELALEIRRELGIEAVAAKITPTYAWGG